MGLPPNRIRLLRKLSKMTQGDLADRIDVTQSTIANWESGFRTPDVDAVVELSKVFNVSTDFLLGISDDPNEKRPAASSDSGLREQAITSLVSLTDSEFQRVLDFVAGLISSRKGS